MTDGRQSTGILTTVARDQTERWRSAFDQSEFAFSVVISALLFSPVAREEAGLRLRLSLSRC
jgi:hypothetical protein